MGLDVSHDCWHGAYSAFSRWRELLERAAGIPQHEVEYGRLEPDIDWTRFVPKNYEGEWDTPPDDPLYILIVHSDCDGRIPTEYCAHLATRLEQLAPLMPTDGGGHLSAPRDQTLQFAAGLRAASEAGEDVEFA